MRVVIGWWLSLLSLVALPAWGEAQDDALSELEALLNTRVSTAAKYDQTVTEAASSVTIITAEDIERYGYRTLAEALNTLAGLYFTDDHVHPHAGIRGFNRSTDFNNRILLLIDGNVANEGVLFTAMSLGNDLGLPIRSLERIEVVRGPGSVLYGAGAMFAVVNLITKSAAAVGGVEAAVQGGSFGERGASMVAGRRLPDGTELMVTGLWAGADGRDLYFPEFDAPETNNGIAHNQDWERRWAAFGTLRRGGLSVRARYVSRTKANPTAPFGNDFNAPNWDRGDHGMLDVAYDHALGAAHQLRARGYLNRYTLDVSRVNHQAPAGVRARGTLVGAETSWRWDIAAANRLSAGMEWRRIFQAEFGVHVDGRAVLDLDSPTTIVSGYVQDEHELTRTLAVLGGLRYDHYTSFGHMLTPRGALIYTPTRSTTFKALYGIAFRAPGLHEMGQADPAEAIRPEKNETIELLWHQRIGPWLFGTASIYRYHVRDLITPVVNEAGDVPGFRNLEHNDATGTELGVVARLPHGISGYANYSYQWATGDSAGRQIADSPTHLAKAGFGLRATRWLRPAVEARYESSRRTLRGTTTDPQFLTDLHLRFSPEMAPGVWDRMELSVRVNNLFDAAYAVPGQAQHRAAVLPQDPRNVTAELRWRF